MKQKRTNHSSAFKAKIALAALKDVSISDTDSVAHRNQD